MAIALETRPRFADTLYCRKCSNRTLVQADEVLCSASDGAFHVRILCHGFWYSVTVTFRDCNDANIGTLVQQRFNTLIEREKLAANIIDKTPATPDAPLVKPMRKIDLE